MMSFSFCLSNKDTNNYVFKEVYFSSSAMFLHYWSFKDWMFTYGFIQLTSK